MNLRPGTRMLKCALHQEPLGGCKGDTMAGRESVRRTIICTTGTSIAQGGPPLQQQRSSEAYRQAVRARLESLRGQAADQETFLKRASAESNSLLRLGLTARDHVVLLHTETDDGRICAEEVQRLLTEAFDVQVDLVRIAGLQVSDEQRFRREGIQNLFSELHRRCRGVQFDPEAKVILNATGGFKSTVPYLTLYGLLYQLPVVYIFERSDALLWLPPAPIHFDYERVARAEKALRRLHKETGMAKEEFFRLIPHLEYHERPWFEALLEEHDGEVTLSAFGLLLLEALEREQSQVYISGKAKKAYEASAGIARSQFTFMLERVRDPLWRIQKRHAIQNTELEVFKPGSTAQRIGCLVRGSTVYVCELIDGHDYSVIEGKRASDYELADFVPWTRPPEEPAPPETEEEQEALLQAAERRLRAEREEFQRLWSQAEERAEALAADLARKQAELDEQRLACMQADERAAEMGRELDGVRIELQSQRTLAVESANEISRLQGELDACRRELAAARRPWWQRLWKRKAD